MKKILATPTSIILADSNNTGNNSTLNSGNNMAKIVVQSTPRIAVQGKKMYGNSTSTLYHNYSRSGNNNTSVKRPAPLESEVYEGN
jgi:hypothetical protein